MLSGIFWFDEDTRRAAASAVARAAACYRSRFRREPTLCLVPPGIIHGEISRMGNITVRSDSSLPPRYLWIGTDREPVPRASRE